MGESYDSLGSRVVRHFRHFIDGDRHLWLKGNYFDPDMAPPRTVTPSPSESSGVLNPQRHQIRSSSSSSYIPSTSSSYQSTSESLSSSSQHLSQSLGSQDVTTQPEPEGGLAEMAASQSQEVEVLEASQDSDEEL